MPATATVGCLLEVVAPQPVDAVLSVAAASVVTDSLQVDAEVREVRDAHGSRLHLLRLPAGTTTVRYDGTALLDGAPRLVSDLEAAEALRPSRYAPSDLLAGLAIRDFSPGTPVADVVQWVSDRLAYDGTASRPVDSALDTLLTGRGVCRDFAHLTVALLRALDVPARVASVYAPGLSPMDFHAVAEVAVDGRWEVHDATRLAPRPSLVRIATGRDAADTAFLSTTGAPVDLVTVEVWASTDGPLPVDAPTWLA